MLNTTKLSKNELDNGFNVFYVNTKMVGNGGYHDGSSWSDDGPAGWYVTITHTCHNGKILVDKDMDTLGPFNSYQEAAEEGANLVFDSDLDATPSVDSNEKSFKFP
jgi:hypothetical protein